MKHFFNSTREFWATLVAAIPIIIAATLTWQLSDELRLLCVGIGFWMLYVNQQLRELKAIVDRRAREQRDSEYRVVREITECPFPPNST